MLERKRFVLAARPGGFDILDADTGEAVGTAREHVGRAVTILRGVLPRVLLPARVQVREKPDDSLVFTVRRGSPFRPRVVLVDSQDAPVGRFVSAGGLVVLDHRGACFAVARRVAGGFALVSADGAAELGRWAGGVLEVSPELAERPFAKMLVLGAVLVAEVLVG